MAVDSRYKTFADFLFSGLFPLGFGASAEVPGTFVPDRTYLVGLMGSGRMPEDAQIVQPKLFPEAGALGRVVAEAERWLRPVDRFDYLVRRWLIPVRFEEPTQSRTPNKVLVQHKGLSSDIQRAIGQSLRAQNALEGSLPARLAKLLREFEQRNSRTGGFQSGGYAST
jgi:hypothetical protein